MVLDSHRSKVDFIMDPVAKAMVKVPPNHISLIALALAALAGALLYLSHAHWELLPVAAVVVLVSGFFDGLDGKVARLVGKADRTGDFLDHVLDRYADMLMIGGVAVSAWCSPYLGMMALVGVLLTSYMGTQAQAVGAKRMYAGLLGRADRIVLSFLAPLVQLGMVLLGSPEVALLGYEINAFEAMMLWFAVVGNLTAIQRAVLTYSWLRKA
ncbi:MAG TPA: CDP-alcohol phosphatidyltransferase family protein [Methanomassiliicoccales archaeon]|jgi:archaetidylinositol phosphate synthase|nr:CDP-alcohol phosphatidyltransferase family protein [Methanomassiliicoccales archaeon]MCE5261337.1 CDP-alcohol phosphatidyltransferase family protein [Euryarchaeota archaeon]HOE53265.1 CDP-alcohol phosphatidyltransferase family protein [Methanomassiliicoccales archaeon]HQM67469.1 CDP-alcohol phosphatidyltransferase family protein [Methanomassiliicoccales archaeon]